MLRQYVISVNTAVAKFHIRKALSPRVHFCPASSHDLGRPSEYLPAQGRGERRPSSGFVLCDKVVASLQKVGQTDR